MEKYVLGNSFENNMRLYDVLRTVIRWLMSHDSKIFVGPLKNNNYNKKIILSSLIHMYNSISDKYTNTFNDYHNTLSNYYDIFICYDSRYTSPVII